MHSLVSVNGVVSAPEEAKISVYDRGFLFGDAVYEVTRSYDGILFAAEEHLARLRRSAEAIGLDLGKTDLQILAEMYQLAAMLKSSPIYIRLQVSRGSCAPTQVSIKPSNSTVANYVYYLHPLKDWPAELYTNGIRLGVSQHLRNDKRALDPNIKSGNYLNNILGLLDTAEYFDDCIFLNSRQEITEGSTFNLFLVKDGCVITPPDALDLLQGITRQIVISLCKKMGVEVIHKSFGLEDVALADEVFITSSTKEIMPVASVGTILKSPTQPKITMSLATAYKDYVRQYCDKVRGIHPI